MERFRGGMERFRGGGGGGGAGTKQAATKGEAPRKPGRKPTSKQTSMWLYVGLALVAALAAVGLEWGGMLSSSTPKPPESAHAAGQAVPAGGQGVPAGGRSDVPPKRAGTIPPKPKEVPPKPSLPPTRIDPGCVDDDESCASWAKSGECFRNEGFMHKSCRASCHVCEGGKPKPKRPDACEDGNDNCATWAAIGECQSNPGFMLQNCPVTCKMCQSETCKDDLPDCAERCRGGVASNFSENLNCFYEPELVAKCAWTCGACKEHRFDRPRCTRDRNAKAAAKDAGDVDRIFDRIVAEEAGVSVLSREPWVITLDDFLSPEECEAILKAGSNGGSAWQRSQAGDGVQAARTSSTSWCSDHCLQDPTIKAVEQRVSTLMGGVPMENAEPMQILRYETGQFYKVHHDQNSPRASAWGPRQFTVFMYIGDGYTGGQTHFPRLNLTIPLKKGAACVWTSVLDSDPYQRDDRTDHESLPVESGIKYGVNYWLHMYPFRGKGAFCGNQAYIQNWGAECDDCEWDWS